MSQQRIVLVTGANKGVGLEVARQLGHSGAHVLLGSRDRERGEQAAAALREEGCSVQVLGIDVTDERTLAAAAEHVECEHGRLDALVNNAGAIVEAPAAKLAPQQIRDVLEVNVIGAVAAIHALLDSLAASPAPCIVNVSSTTASFALTSAGTDFGGNAELRIAYSTSKTALNMLTLQYALAFDRDERLEHIKINAVAPGFVATDLNDHTGTLSTEEGARAIVALASLDDRGPTGSFFNDRGPTPW